MASVGNALVISAKSYDGVHRGIMLNCPWADGYRIQRDIDLKELGSKYTLQNVSPEENSEPRSGGPDPAAA